MTDPHTHERGVKITSIELHEFEYEVRDFGTLETSEVYEPGTRRRRTTLGLKVCTDAGITGEYVSTFTVIEPATLGWVAGLILGRNALERERIYDEVKRATRHVGRLGIAPLDIALWVIAGKYYDAPIYELLGGTRKRLRVYALPARAVLPEMVPHGAHFHAHRFPDALLNLDYELVGPIPALVSAAQNGAAIDGVEVDTVKAAAVHDIGVGCGDLLK